MLRRGLIIAVAIAGLSLPSAASAGWTAQGSGSGSSKAKTMPGGNTPSASVSGRSVTVSWSASALAGGGAVDGYTVRRYSSGGASQTIGANCTGTVTGLTCTERGVAAGTWKYSVAPVLGNWTGAESAQSPTVTVGAPALALSPSSVTSLPATLSGQISDFIDGQTVSFRLDDQTSGQVLSGSITPSPVPSDGTASVSVTVPAGTANGSHAIYAIGDQGDVASASVTIAVPTTTITSSVWDVRDASSGTETNQSAGDAFANDSRTVTTGKFGAFAATRYVQFGMNAPLAGGGTVGSASFNFNYAPANPNATACFYFEVRRASTNAVLASHGSAASPVACNSSTTLQATTTPIPEVSTTAIADDLSIRVFASNNGGGGKPILVDLATVSGAVGNQAFTLYDRLFVDAATGTATTLPWGLAAAGDGAFYQSASSWLGTFTSARYLKLSFPSYVPTGSTMNGVTFKHAYRSAGAATTCFYFEVYSGATLLATHGSAAAPVSCNSSTSTYVTDAVALPEVNTPGKANGLIVKMYLNSSGAQASQHDLAELSLSYSN
jgi:hypothetical protein